MGEHASEAQNFQKLYAQAAVATMKETLGESGAMAILYHVKSLFPGTENILEEPEKLGEGITKFFGEHGAYLLEKQIFERVRKGWRSR